MAIIHMRYFALLRRRCELRAKRRGLARRAYASRRARCAAIVSCESFVFNQGEPKHAHPLLLRGQLGASGMSYWKYESPLEPPMDQIPLHYAQKRLIWLSDLSRNFALA
jgi:hypothetical protein